MKPATSRITSQGQVSVPAEIRRRLSLGPGALIEWHLEGNEVIVRRVGHHSSSDIHRALFGETPARRTLEEIRNGIRRRTAERYARD